MSEKEHMPRSCEHCGGDKPWARPDWLIRDGIGFCSQYCADNNDGYLKRMILGKRFRGNAREASVILSRCYADKKPKQKLKADNRLFIYHNGEKVLYVPKRPVRSFAVTTAPLQTT